MGSVTGHSSRIGSDIGSVGIGTITAGRMGPKEEHSDNPDNDDRDEVNNLDDQHLDTVNKEGPPVLDLRGWFFGTENFCNISQQGNSQDEGCNNQEHPPFGFLKNALFCVGKGVAEHVFVIHFIHHKDSDCIIQDCPSHERYITKGNFPEYNYDSIESLN